DGADGKATYSLPLAVLQKPLPKSADGSGLPDWFALDPAKVVTAGQELASTIPPQPGTPGKSLTWPVQTIVPNSGKPAALIPGQNIRLSDDRLRLYAANDGYVCLQGDTLNVYALRQFAGNVIGESHQISTGAIFMGSLRESQIHTGDFLAIRGVALACQIRA